MEEPGVSRSRVVATWVVLALMFFALWLVVSLYFAAVCLVMAIAVILKLDYRIPFMVSLVLLLIAALFAVLSYDVAANWLVSIGFYAMAMGIVIQFAGFVKDSEVDGEEFGD
jgi:hypothetical protein